MLDGGLGRRVDYEINLYAELSRSPLASLGGSFDTVGAFATPYRSRYLAWDFWDSGSMLGQLGVDRLRVDFDARPFEISVGRMPVNHSVTGIFAPNDFFAPFSATAVNKIYKPGVDTLRVSLATGALSSVEIDGVLGSDGDGVPGWSTSALIARASTVLFGFEWALLGGKLAGRWVAGASLQGEAGPISVRGEGHAGFPDGDGVGGADDLDGDGREADGFHARLAIGADACFPWRNATVGAEYMFVSDGATSPGDYLDRAARLYLDDQPYVGRHYAGLSAGLDLVGILRLQLAGIMNLSDLSGIGAATLVYSISDESEAVLGAMIPWGDAPSMVSTGGALYPSLGSELGTMPTMVFLETRFYF